MSRINLVSKNLLANVFCNCRKRNTVTEKNYVRKSLTNINLFTQQKIFFLLLRFLRRLLYFFYTFLIAVLFKSFLLKLRKTFASKFLLTRSILDISEIDTLFQKWANIGPKTDTPFQKQKIRPPCTLKHRVQQEYNSLLVNAFLPYF